MAEDPRPDGVRALAARLGLDEGFSDAVWAEARALADAPGIDDPRLVDRTGLPFCTIDEPTSMDLDQALQIEVVDRGWCVRYAIADAAWFVRPGTALHAEALRRGGTVYLPGLTARMLPPILSEGAVSLLPDVDRRAVIFALDVDRDGTCTGCRVERARIRSRHKTSYAAVQAWFDGVGPGPDGAIRDSLRALADVGRARIANAAGRGVVRVRRVEVEVGVDGARFVALREARSDVERWNEQISLLANAEGARLLASLGDVAGVEPIYRVVEPPTPAQLDGLRATADQVIAAHALPDGWRWAVDEPLADWLARLPEGPVASALHRAAMLVGGAAVYQPTPGPHAGVGVDVYARFTAPMREIVGVFLHRELLDGLAGVRGSDGLRDEVIAAASRHRRLQRDVDRAVNALVLDQLFAEDLAADRVRTAVVMGLSADKVHLTLDDPPIDAKVYLAHHPDWPVDGRGDAARPWIRDRTGIRFRVGDAVTARVTGRIGDRWALDVAARVGITE